MALTIYLPTVALPHDYTQPISSDKQEAAYVMRRQTSGFMWVAFDDRS